MTGPDGPANAPAGPATPAVPDNVETVLSNQRRLQLRSHVRQGLWIAWVPLLGVGLAAAGLVAAKTLAQSGSGLSRAQLAMLWFGLAYFGLSLAAMATLPFRLQARVVPYFRRKIAEYGGTSSRAFARGRGLYDEAAALDQMADGLGVRPLSSFGFADDFYGQDVRWHAASDGLATVEALRRGLARGPLAHPDLAGDLEALSEVLKLAAETGTEFCLTVRIFRKDSLQVVSAMEPRTGSFW